MRGIWWSDTVCLDEEQLVCINEFEFINVSEVISTAYFYSFDLKNIGGMLGLGYSNTAKNSMWNGTFSSA